MIATILFRNAFKLLSLSLVLAGCIYNPDDENFKIVDPTVEIAPLQIDLELQDDTVDVFGRTIFNYDITGFEPARNYIITFSTDRISGGPVLSEFNGQIEYHPEIDSGFVKATLRVETRSGTNSLADRLGLEKIVFERSWILNIYAKAPKEIKVTSIKREDGSLKVSWEKYNKINFQSYMVIRIKGSDYSVVKTITNPDSSFYFDHAYVGGNVMYSVVTNVKSGTFSSGPFASYDDQETAALVKYERVGNNELKIYWSTSPYPANVGRYEVYEGMFPNSADILLYSTTDPKDTVFTFVPRFGRPAFITVTTYNKLGNPKSELVTSENKEYIFGEKIDLFDDIYFAPTKNRYFTRKDKYLSVYSMDNNELISRIEVPVYMNAFAVTKNESALIGCYESTLYSWDAVSLALNYQRDLSALLGPNQLMMGIGSTVDNKILLCKSNGGTAVGSFLFYDPVLSVIEKEYTGLLVEPSLELSPSGSYVMARTNGRSRIHKLKPDNTVQPVYVSDGRVFFNPSNDSQAIVGAKFSHPNGSILVQDVETWQLIERIETPPIITSDMDPQSGYIAGGVDDGTGMLQVYDYKNKKELLRAAQGSSFFLTMHQGYLYSIEGTRIKFTE